MLSIEQNIALASIVGALVGAVISALISLIKDHFNRSHQKEIQESEILQKRVELHIGYLKENAERMDAQISQESISSGIILGIVVGSEIEGDIESIIEANKVASVHIGVCSGYIEAELAYLAYLVKKYELNPLLMDDINPLIKMAQDARVLLTGDELAKRNGNEKNLNVIIHLLTELRVLYRGTIHILIDKLLYGKPD